MGRGGFPGVKNPSPVHQSGPSPTTMEAGSRLHERMRIVGWVGGWVGGVAWWRSARWRPACSNGSAAARWGGAKQGVPLVRGSRPRAAHGVVRSASQSAMVAAAQGGMRARGGGSDRPVSQRVLLVCILSGLDLALVPY
jgi:hypothetical protein